MGRLFITDPTRYDPRNPLSDADRRRWLGQKEELPEGVEERIKAAKEKSEAAMLAFSKKVRAEGWEVCTRMFSISETDARLAVQQSFYNKEQNAGMIACFGGSEGQCTYLERYSMKDGEKEVLVPRIPVSL